MKQATKFHAAKVSAGTRSEGKRTVTLNVAKVTEYMSRTRSDFASKMKSAESISSRGTFAGPLRKR